MDTHDPDRLLEVQEAAELLQVKPGTLYSWVSQGKVPFRKVGALVRFHRGELLAWTEGNRTEAKQITRRSKLRVVK
jgi:excisionase family DNA binding protein